MRIAGCSVRIDQLLKRVERHSSITKKPTADLAVGRLLSLYKVCRLGTRAAHCGGGKPPPTKIVGAMVSNVPHHGFKDTAILEPLTRGSFKKSANGANALRRSPLSLKKTYRHPCELACSPPRKGQLPRTITLSIGLNAQSLMDHNPTETSLKRNNCRTYDGCLHPSNRSCDAASSMKRARLHLQH